MAASDEWQRCNGIRLGAALPTSAASRSSQTPGGFCGFSGFLQPDPYSRIPHLCRQSAGDCRCPQLATDQQPARYGNDSVPYWQEHLPPHPEQILKPGNILHRYHIATNGRRLRNQNWLSTFRHNHRTMRKT